MLSVSYFTIDSLAPFAASTCSERLSISVPVSEIRVHEGIWRATARAEIVPGPGRLLHDDYAIAYRGLRFAPGRDTTRRSTTTSMANGYGPVESSELTEVSLSGQADAGVRGEWRGVELGWLRVRASHGFSAPLRARLVRALLS